MQSPFKQMEPSLLRQSTRLNDYDYVAKEFKLHRQITSHTRFLIGLYAKIVPLSFLSMILKHGLIINYHISGDTLNYLYFCEF